MRRLASILAAPCLLLGCGQEPAALGLLLSSSPSEAARAVEEGIEVALARAGEGPWPVVRLRTGGAASDVASACALLVEQGASLIVGPLDGQHTEAAAAAAALLGVPLLAPTSGEIGGAGRGAASAFGIGVPPAAAAEHLAGLAFERLGLRAFAVLVDLRRPEEVALARAFTAEVAERSGRIVGEWTWPLGWAGDAATWDDLAGSDAEAVLVACSGADSAAQLRAAQRVDLGGLVLLGGMGWRDPSLGPALAGRVAGAYALRAFAPEETGAAALEFLRDFEVRFGRAPDDLAALGFDAARIARHEFDPRLSGPALAARLRALRRFTGATGRIDMGPEGAPRERSAVLVQLHDPHARAFLGRSGD